MEAARGGGRVTFLKTDLADHGAFLESENWKGEREREKNQKLPADCTTVKLEHGEFLHYTVILFYDGIDHVHSVWKFCRTSSHSVWKFYRTSSHSVCMFYCSRGRIFVKRGVGQNLNAAANFGMRVEGGRGRESLARGEGEIYVCDASFLSLSHSHRQVKRAENNIRFPGDKNTQKFSLSLSPPILE